MTGGMRTTLTLTAEVRDQLHAALEIDSSSIEHAAFVICGISRTERETRLLGREVIEVPPADVLEQDEVHMRISYEAVFRAMRRAHDTGGTILFVHSHPAGASDFSKKDDEEEVRLSSVASHYDGQLQCVATAVVSGPDGLKVRAWEDGVARAVTRVRVVGRTLEFPVYEDYAPNYARFDRQVRAFGKDIQHVLAGLTVAVVGAGGTGSATAEQLVRLGVGRVMLFDSQMIADTNVSRIHESILADVGRPKVDVLAARLSEIHRETVVDPVPHRIVIENVAKKLRDCDVIFGCTDDHLGRYILNRLAFDYLIPVFDMGAVIDSEGGKIRSVACRVTRLQPGHACLGCRGLLDPDRMQRDALPEEQYAGLVEQRYAKDLDEPDPAVAPFTTVAAGLAVSQFIDYLTAYRGADVDADHVVLRFDTLRLIRGSEPAGEGCWCGKSDEYGQGDRALFLDTTWTH